MDNCFGQHGWREFNRNRKDILADLDKLLEQTVNRPVQVAHGHGVEASIRKWLAEFLPKKYGVTSGYIVPDLYDDNLTLYHFDIIIYNQLEAPILWTEGNFDQSEQGKFRAIPAKHIVAVYEVKARLTKSNVADSIKKLKQTEGYADQLHPLYSCGIIFIDLKQSENEKEDIIKELIKGKNVHRFYGGMILRYENDHTATGRIRVFNTSTEDNFKNDHLTPIAKPIDELNIYMNEEGNLQISEQGGGIMLVSTSLNNFSVSKSYGVGYNEENTTIYIDWSRSNFSEFCIDLISRLEGLVFNDKKRPTFGRIFDTIEPKKTPLQSDILLAEKPFLTVDIYEGGEYGNKLDIIDDSVIFSISIQNKGKIAVTISDDQFKNTIELPPGITAVKKVSLGVTLKSLSKKSLKEKLNKKPLEFVYKLVYYSDSENKDFTAIEKKIKVFKNDISIVKA